MWQKFDINDVFWRGVGVEGGKSVLHGIGIESTFQFLFFIFFKPDDCLRLSYVALVWCWKLKFKNNKEKKQKWMQHRDFPGGHPSQYYSGPKALNFRVLMGSGVVALVWPHHDLVRSRMNSYPILPPRCTCLSHELAIISILSLPSPLIIKHANHLLTCTDYGLIHWLTHSWASYVFQNPPPLSLSLSLSYSDFFF